MTLTSEQIRKACALLTWTPLMLAERALITLDEVASARDENGIHSLGGLQLGSIRRALEGAGAIFVETRGERPCVRLRMADP